MNFTIWKEIENFSEQDFFSWFSFYMCKNFMDKLPLSLILCSFFLWLQHYDKVVAKWKSIPINN
jgi:hypothetical protein